MAIKDAKEYLEYCIGIWKDGSTTSISASCMRALLDALEKPEKPKYCTGICRYVEPRHSDGVMVCTECKLPVRPIKPICKECGTCKPGKPILYEGKMPPTRCPDCGRSLYALIPEKDKLDTILANQKVIARAMDYLVRRGNYKVNYVTESLLSDLERIAGGKQ